MFEDSLVESGISHISTEKRWTALASITFQSVLTAMLIVLPLLHPEHLAFRAAAPSLLTPLPPKPPLRIQRTQASSAPSSAAFIPITTRRIELPSLFPSLRPTTDETPPAVLSTLNMSGSLPAALGVAVDEHRAGISIALTSKPGPMRISSGVSVGLLMAPIRPVYPAIAKAAGVQGTVVVEAVISRSGIIESLHVVSGPPVLRSAALDAIRAARYQPYRLNGEPTEVETTITVNFRLTA